MLIAIIIVVFNSFFFENIKKEETSKPSKSEEIIDLSKEVTNSKTINKIHKKNQDIKKETKSDLGIFSKNVNGIEKNYVLKNEFLKLVFSNKGGRIISAELLNFKTFNKDPLLLFDEDSSLFNLQFTTGKLINTKDLFFEATESNNQISMKLYATDEKYIEFNYKLNNYI